MVSMLKTRRGRSYSLLFLFADAIFVIYTLKIVADQNFTLNAALLFLYLKSGRGLIPYFFPFADVIVIMGCGETSDRHMKRTDIGN